MSEDVFQSAFRSARYLYGHVGARLPAATRPGVAAIAVEETGPNEVEVAPTPRLVFVLASSDRVGQESDLSGRRRAKPFPAQTHVLIPPGQPSWWRNRGPAGRLLHVHFDPGYFDHIERLRAAGLQEPREAAPSPVVGALGAAVGTLLEVGSPEPILFDHLLAALAVALFGIETPVALRRGGLAPWQVRRCLEYMRAHLAEDITLDELAQLVGLSRFHFSRAFRVSTGRPPLGHLRALRAEVARGLLTSTDLPVGEVGARVGYETAQAFSRMFFDEVGAPPSQFRRLRTTAPEGGSGA